MHNRVFGIPRTFECAFKWLSPKFCRGIFETEGVSQGVVYCTELLHCPNFILVVLGLTFLLDFAFGQHLYKLLLMSFYNLVKGLPLYLV